MSGEEEAKKRLLDLLAQASDKADRQEAIAREIQQAAQQAREVAIPSRVIIQNLPAGSIPASEMAHQISVWSSWHKAADEITKVQVQTTRVFVATTSAVFNTSTSMLSSFGPAEESKIAVAKTQLFQALDRATLVKRADAEMGRLGLKGRAGTIRTPPELLEDADQAFKARGGPATILIPLRESIDGALAALLKRRALQEPASNPEEKVKSIGRQCGREGLPEAHFPDLGASARRIADELSRAKQQNLSREKISDLFYQGITFLTALLESLDEAKLK